MNRLTPSQAKSLAFLATTLGQAYAFSSGTLDALSLVLSLGEELSSCSLKTTIQL